MRAAICAVVLSASLVVSLSSALAADGDLDSNFGGGTGIVFLPFTVTSETVRQSGGLAIQPDGKIVAAGSVRDNVFDMTSSLALARIDDAGVLDPTFGTGGLVITALSGLHARAAGLQPDGKIIVLALDGDIRLVRFTSTGVLDGGFGTGGVVTTDCGGNEEGPGDLVVRPDGTIVVAATRPSGPQACVVQYRPDGTLDPAFAGGAPVQLPTWTITSAALAPDGTLLVAGNQTTPDQRFAVARLGTDGSIAGVSLLDVPPQQLAVSVTTDANGNAHALSSTFDVVRFKPNGAPDASFGVDGVAAAPITGPQYDFYGAQAIRVQPDGKIVVGAAGITFMGAPFGNSSDIVLERLDVDGALDPTYGVGGVQMTSAPVGITALHLAADGDAIASGSTRVSPGFGSNWEIVRHVGFTYTCPPTPEAGCKTSIAPLAGSLKLDAAADTRKNKEQWSWQKGEDVTVGDFGDPVGGDATAICMYDESGMTPVLVSWAVVPGAGLCKGKPCWRAKTASLQYGDGRRSRFGIAAIKFKAGTGGAAKLQLKGQGGGVALPQLPLGIPVRVQLVSASGGCFESVFSAANVTRNESGKFQAKSD